MKKTLQLIVMVLFFTTGLFAQSLLKDATIIDSTGTDFFFRCYIGTQGQQITVDDAGKVHVVYTKTWFAESDTGYQVKYANITDGKRVDIPSQQPEETFKSSSAFIAGGTDGRPVYILTGLSGFHAYSYAVSLPFQALTLVNGDKLEPKGKQENQFYWAAAYHSTINAVEVGANGMVHVLHSNPMGDPVLYWNFDGSNISKVSNLLFNYGQSTQGKYQEVPENHRMNFTEGSDLAVSEDGKKVAVVTLHSFNQIWIHKLNKFGTSWESDFGKALSSGDLVPLFDTTQAVKWLPNLYEANKARPYTDAQIVYGPDGKLVVTYVATYRSHWLDTTNYIGVKHSPGDWRRNHKCWPGDSTGVFFDGTEKAKPQIMAWTEKTGQHTVVTEAIYPKAGETFKWYHVGGFDSSLASFDITLAGGIIGNLKLVVDKEQGNFILLFKQMNSNVYVLPDTVAKPKYLYFGYKNDIFSIASDNGSNWSDLQNLSNTPDLDENDISVAVAKGKVHIMWTSDKFEGRDMMAGYEKYRDRFVTYTGGNVFGYPIRKYKEDYCQILYKEVPLNKIVSVKENNNLPMEYKISQNYPNPFNPTTTIKFNAPKKAEVTVKVYNALGQLVETLINGTVEAGEHTITWDASNVASGVYLYKIEADNYSDTKKMILLK